MAADGKRCGEFLEPAALYCVRKLKPAKACDRSLRIRRRAANLFTLVLFSFGAAQLSRSACTPPNKYSEKLRDTPDAAVYGELGGWYADQKEFACAAETFRKAVALQPASARYNYLLGLSLYSAGNAKDAVGPLEQSLRLDPESVEAHMTLGATLDQTGGRSAAEMQWRLALARDPGSGVALENLSRDLLADRNYGAVITLLHPMDISGTLTDELAVNLSVAYSKSGMPQDAADLLHKKLQSNPASLPLAEALSGVLILQSRFQDSIQVLDPLAKQHPDDIRLQILYLQALVLAHDSGAEALARRLMASNPGQWELPYFLGVLRQQAGDDAGARDYFQRSIALNPDDADSRYRLGSVLVSLKDNAAAKLQLEKAIALGIDAPEVHVALAKALRALGDTGGAQRQFQLYQQQLQAQAARAQAADKAQQGDQAEAAGNAQQTAEDYREAVALDPHEPLLAYKLAMALDKTGDRAGERMALEKAIEIDPRMAMAQNQLGYLDSSEGNIEAAIQHFQLAVLGDPAFTKAWLNLAASLCLESRWSDARDALNHVLELDSGNANARALLQRIGGMQAQR
jgi:Flp pilus assembly protein TadD